MGDYSFENPAPAPRATGIRYFLANLPKRHQPVGNRDRQRGAPRYAIGSGVQWRRGWQEPVVDSTVGPARVGFTTDAPGKPSELSCYHGVGRAFHWVVWNRLGRVDDIHRPVQFE